MQPMTAQTKVSKFPDVIKYIAVSGFFSSAAIAMYLFTIY